MVPAKRLISALAVLYTVLVVAQAAGQPSLRDILNKRPAAVSTASVVQDDSYGYEQNYGIETKEVCLQETEQKVCTWVNNCLDDGATAIAAPTTPTCIIGQLWTSDFACCQERNYGYDAPSGLRNTQLWAGAASIGTCDWTVLYSDVNTLGKDALSLGVVQDPATGNAVGDVLLSGEQSAITNNIWKLGSVWATCYLGPESETCGGPLCDRMVMSMQGTAYRALTAYSHWGPSDTQDPTCFETNGPDGPLRVAAPDGGRQGVNGSTAPATRKNSRAIRRGTRTVSRAPTAELQYNSGGGYYNGHDNNEQDVFSGEATIFMGIITSLAGQRKEKWEEGVFEYVPYFQVNTAITQPITTGLDASVPWVRDKTYKLTFYKSGKY